MGDISGPISIGGSDHGSNNSDAFVICYDACFDF